LAAAARAFAEADGRRRLLESLLSREGRVTAAAAAVVDVSTTAAGSSGCSGLQEKK
jgi:hypothetical protein